MGPLDYRTQVLDPIGMALQGYAQRVAQGQAERQMGQQDRALGQADRRLDMAQEQLAMQQAEAQRAQQVAATEAAAQKAYVDYILNPVKTSDSTAAVIRANPQLAEAVMQVWQGQNEEQRRGLAQFGMQFVYALKSGNVDAAKGLLDRRIQAAEAAGDKAQADAFRAERMQLDAGQTDVVLSDAMVTLYGGMSPKEFDGFTKSLPGAVAPDATGVQSSQIIAGRIAVQQMRDGTVRVVDATTNEVLTGERAAEAIRQAEAAGIEFAGGSAGARAEATRLADIELGREAEAAKAAGREVGTSRGQAEVGANSAAAAAQYSLDLIRGLREHPGLPSIVGNVQGRLPAGMPLVTGGQSGADAEVRLAQMQGRVFMQAFESLKGGGQITEKEGQAATAALARLQRSQSLEEMMTALSELEAIYTTALDRAIKAGAAPVDIASDPLRSARQKLEAAAQAKGEKLTLEEIKGALTGEEYQAVIFAPRSTK